MVGFHKLDFEDIGNCSQESGLEVVRIENVLEEAV